MTNVTIQREIKLVFIKITCLKSIRKSYCKQTVLKWSNRFISSGSAWKQITDHIPKVTRSLECNQIRSFMHFCSQLLETSLMENFTFCFCSIRNSIAWILMIKPWLNHVEWLECLFDKVAGLQTCKFVKIRLQQRWFPVNFSKNFKSPYILKHLWWILLFF